MSEPLRLLIVDTQQSICSLCAELAERMGLTSFQALSAEQALEGLDRFAPELMLTDLVLGEGSGLDLLAEVKKRSPLTEVALMSAHGTIASAVQAMRLGAHDFVVKPFRTEEMQLVLEGMSEKARSAREIRAELACTDLEDLERRTMQRVFEQVDGDKEQAQKLLGISRATLYRKIKRYGIRKRPAQPEEVSRETQERMVLLSQS